MAGVLEVLDGAQVDPARRHGHGLIGLTSMPVGSLSSQPRRLW
jgi:hypothetical protein